MLGESIGEMKGKISSQRVLDVDGPTMETNVSASGSLKGVQVNEHSPMWPVLHQTGYSMVLEME
jgi:hypothetical protein